MISLSVAIWLAGLAPWWPDAPNPLPIKFDTSDGVTVGADYFAPKLEVGKKAPVAILIHMYPMDRKSWAPIIPFLHDVGFAILAYDVRGKGQSVLPAERDLRGQYGKRDPALFAEAWRDAEGAKNILAKQADCDVSRLVVIGASVGSSIAIDFARRDKDVKAIVCLSPYVTIFGLDTAAHIKEVGKRAILLLSPQREYSRSLDLVKSSGGVAKSEYLPGGPSQHGSLMLEEPMYATHACQMITDFVREPAGLGPPPKPAENRKDASKSEDTSKKNENKKGS